MKNHSHIFLSTITICITIFSCTTKPNDNATKQADDTSTQKQHAHQVHWSYQGETGPDKWATLSPAYALCGEGKGQSPVNISKVNSKGEVKLKFDYKTTSLRIAHSEHVNEILNNGHTIQVTVDEGSTFAFGDKKYQLKQFHFHTPSEHTFDGKHAPMEMHLVHQNEEGLLAVVGVMFKEGAIPNANFEKIIANLPAAKGDTVHVADAILDLNVHLPMNNYAYHYVGSLTTPPCSEGVEWFVLRDPIELTKEQISAFSTRIGPNNRPVQSLNQRTIEVGDVKEIDE